jgi:hypothetical protein
MLDLDADVRAAAERLRVEQRLGLSEAVDRLAFGMRVGPPQPYVHASARLGLRIDGSNIGDVLELLDEA